MRFYVDQWVKSGAVQLGFQLKCLFGSLQYAKEVKAYRESLSRLEETRVFLDIIPQKGLVYIPIPKAATSKIKRLLDEIDGNRRVFLNRNTKDRFGNPPTMRELNPVAANKALHAKSSLRFTFVRNPYARLASAWVDKFKDKPLVPGAAFSRGTPEIDTYLALLPELKGSLPSGKEVSLGFRDFVTYAIESKDLKLDNHIRSQASIVEDSEVTLDFVGRVERFSEDFEKIIDQVGGLDFIRPKVSKRVHSKKGGEKVDLFDSETKQAVYQAYRADFDRFDFSKELG